MQVRSWIFKSHFFMKGYNTIKVQYIGDNIVFLSGENEDILEDIFEGETSGWKPCLNL